MSLVFIFSFFQILNWVKFYFMSQIKSVSSLCKLCSTTVLLKTSLRGYSHSVYETQGSVLLHLLYPHYQECGSLHLWDVQLPLVCLFLPWPLLTPWESLWRGPQNPPEFWVVSCCCQELLLLPLLRTPFLHFLCLLLPWTSSACSFPAPPLPAPSLNFLCLLFAWSTQWLLWV